MFSCSHVSVHIRISGSADSIITDSSSRLCLILWQFMIKILMRLALLGLPLCFVVCSGGVRGCTGDEVWRGGPKLDSSDVSVLFGETGSSREEYIFVDSSASADANKEEL